MALAMTGDTWGISGPVFLVAYLLLAAAVGVAGFMTRRALADPRPDRPLGDVTAHPHDVAYLNGGAELAVLSALSAMHLRGTIVSERGKVRAVGRLGRDDDDLEVAIHRTASGRVQRRRLPTHKGVATALQRIEERLVAGGLLLSGEHRRRHRAVAWWTVAVAALGAVRLLAGIAEARPIGFLIIAMIGVGVVAAVQFAHRPRRSRTGNDVLRGLARRHQDLAPTMRPDWVLHGPAGAALAIGVFGMGALWASDPAFAAELATQRVIAGGSADGGAGFVGGGDSGGSGGGGGGGCGGGGCGG